MFRKASATRVVTASAAVCRASSTAEPLRELTSDLRAEWMDMDAGSTALGGTASCGSAARRVVTRVVSVSSW